MSPSKAELRAQKAAEVKAAQVRRERRRRFLTIGGVIVAMALIVGGSILISALTRTEVEPADVGASEYGFVYGDADADHTVVIYEDFLCSHCASLEDAAGADLTAQADAGNVLIDYRPIAILGDDSVRALNAFKVVLTESGPEVAKEFHDALFAHYDEAPLSDDELVDLAVDSGADEDAVRDGIEDLAQQNWVEDASAAAAEDGVTATPTVVLDGEQFADGRSAAEVGRNLVAAVE